MSKRSWENRWIQLGEVQEFGEAACASRKDAKALAVEAERASAPDVDDPWPYIVEWVRKPAAVECVPSGWGWYGIGKKRDRIVDVPL